MKIAKEKLRKSTQYKNWIAQLDLRTCQYCRDTHGKIYGISEVVPISPPVHPRCRCVLKVLSSILAGQATEKGRNGADWWLKHYGKLPNYYITEAEAKEKGFRAKLGNLASVLPGRMLTKGEYQNDDGHLPSAPNRVWYEADINYTRGYRGRERVLFSNDGLIFVTYDHYHTFYEII